MTWTAKNRNRIMTITTRLSLFFLGALAVVLVGFSSTVYLLARTYLNRQVEDRLEAVLNTLTAGAEIEPGGLEWEPHERHLYLDQDLGGGPLPWLVTDADGKWVDGSKHFFPEKRFADSPLAHFTGPSSNPVVQWQERPWLVSQRRLENKNLAVPPSQPQANQQKQLYPALVITGGVSLADVETTLRNLAISLVVVSSGIWLMALVGGRWLCRRALLPVTNMANAARKMDAGDLGQCLPIADTCDEVADLGLAFNDLLARLHESFERHRRFTGDASHQLRTPLTAILGQIEVALRRDRSLDEYQRVLGSVQGQAQFLRQIVEMLLFLARANAEAKLPNLEIIQLTDWLKEHLHEWSTHERFADLRVEADIPLPVEAQPPLLGQLVDNLLDNACKYSQPGTPIVIRLIGDKDSVFLTVEDSGCGIAPDDLPHVFKPFFRSSQARQRGFSGIGLGLAVAERIATAFGGRITASSEPGKGSCFRLQLPQATSVGRNDSTQNPHSQPRDVAPDCKR